MKRLMYVVALLFLAFSVLDILRLTVNGGF